MGFGIPAATERQPVRLNPFGALRDAREKRAQDAVDALAQAFFYGGNVSATGVRVTPETALASVAVAACIEVRAETFSSLPGGVFRKEDRKRIPLPDHPVAKLLFDRPNDLMTSLEMWRWKQLREDITGNSYLRIVWNGGQAAELWPLYGEKPQIKTQGGKVTYAYRGDDFTKADSYPASAILHFKGPFVSTSPYEARSPIDLVKESIGLSIASEQFFGRFLNNGNHFPSYLETDSSLTKKDADAITEQLGSTAGIFAAGQMRIFDRGLKLKQNAMSLKDADLTAQMRWYLEQICRLYRVPLPIVQDWTHGTYTNSEQAGLWLGQHVATPICRNTEAASRKLFIPGEEALYTKFNVDAALRGDYQTRTAGYSVLINCGVMSPNEARALEDMDPFDGGDEHRLPLNTAPAGAPLAAEPPAPAKNTVKAEEVITAPDATITPRDAAHLAPLVADAVARIRKRVDQDRASQRDEARTLEFADRVLAPLAEAHALAGVPFDREDIEKECGL